MQEVVSEPTDKYPDIFIRNLAQKHMEDKQVELMIDLFRFFFFFCIEFFKETLSFLSN